MSTAVPYLSHVVFIEKEKIKSSSIEMLRTKKGLV